MDIIAINSTNGSKSEVSNDCTFSIKDSLHTLVVKKLASLSSVKVSDPEPVRVNSHCPTDDIGWDCFVLWLVYN
jgi:hypothetical protein